MGDDDNYVKRIKKVPTPLWKKKKIKFLQRESHLNICNFTKTYRGKVGCVVMETLPGLKGGYPGHLLWWKMVRHLCDMRMC